MANGIPKTSSNIPAVQRTPSPQTKKAEEKLKTRAQDIASLAKPHLGAGKLPPSHLFKKEPPNSVMNKVVAPNLGAGHTPRVTKIARQNTLIKRCENVAKQAFHFLKSIKNR